MKIPDNRGKDRGEMWVLEIGSGWRNTKLLGNRGKKEGKPLDGPQVRKAESWGFMLAKTAGPKSAEGEVLVASRAHLQPDGGPGSGRQ